MSNRYEITSLIEVDRLGEVFLALDVTLQRKVVYRKFKCEKGVRLPDDFSEYTGKLSALQHPNILTIYDISKNDEGYFMVTQFIEAESLVDRLLQGPLSQTGVHNMASDLLDALHAMHVKGIIHGALRSDSVKRLPRVRGGHRYLLVDLGLDKMASMIGGSDEGGADTVLTAPELLDGSKIPDEQSDLFALGQLCYIALAGGHPMAEYSASDLIKVYEDGGMPDLREYSPDVQEDFAAWIMSLIAIDPEQRPASTDVAMASLHAIVLNVPAPNVPGVTQAVVEVAPSVPPGASSSIEVSAEQTKSSLVGKLKALPKKVLLMVGLALLLVLGGGLMLSGRSGSGSLDGGDSESLRAEPAYLKSTEMIQSLDQSGDPLLVELDTQKSLDWTVIKGVPSSSERVDKSGGSYISSVFPHGDFKEFAMPREYLSYHGNGMTITPRGAMTGVDKGMAEFGQGWDVMLRIPKNHKGPLSVTFYMLQNECDFDVSVKLPKSKEVIKLTVSYDSVGEKPGVVKIPVNITKPIPGEFYLIEVRASSENLSREFEMALCAVVVAQP